MPILSTTNWLNYYSTTSAGLTAALPFVMTLFYVQTFGAWPVNNTNISTLFVQVFS